MQYTLDYWIKKRYTLEELKALEYDSFEYDPDTETVTIYIKNKIKIYKKIDDKHFIEVKEYEKAEG